MSSIERRRLSDGISAVKCPECGLECIPKAIKAGLHRIFGCPDHGLVDHWSGDTARMLSCRAGLGWMNPEERLWLLERAFQEFLGEPVDEDYLIVEDPAHPEHYVQFMHHGTDGVIFAEVGSREWNCSSCGNRPLLVESHAGLAALGFEGGGICKNYSRDGIKCMGPLDIARLAERLFFVAYHARPDFEVAVQFKNDSLLHHLYVRLIFERHVAS